jgi:hypothetical protein
MEEKKETIYRFNGDEALQKASPGKAFYLVTENPRRYLCLYWYWTFILVEVQNGSTYMLSFAKKRRMLIRD